LPVHSIIIIIIIISDEEIRVTLSH